VLETLELFYQGVYFDEFLERSAGSGEPIVEAIIIGEIMEDGMIVVLQKLVDDTRMKRASEVSMQICV